jgi:hypothetical protein
MKKRIITTIIRALVMGQSDISRNLFGNQRLVSDVRDVVEKARFGTRRTSLPITTHREILFQTIINIIKLMF